MFLYNLNIRTLAVINHNMPVPNLWAREQTVGILKKNVRDKIIEQPGLSYTKLRNPIELKLSVR